jgi:thiamine pyrophosphokinase
MVNCQILKQPVPCCKPGDYLIAADGGANHLMKMGILPGIVIGDLDSVDEDTLFELASAGSERSRQYSEDKNETDIRACLALRDRVAAFQRS